MPTYSFDDLFAELFPAKAKGLVEIRALPSKKRIFVHPSDRRMIREFLIDHERQDIYFGVATRLRRGDGRLENCADLWGLFIDIDFKNCSELEARKRLADFPFPPSIIIRSGGGLHVYWLLRFPVDLQHMHDRLRSLLRRLAVAVGGDLSAAEGARVLRLPGTKNFKYDPARLVTIEVFRPRRVYELDEIERALPAEQSSNVQAAHFKVPNTIPYLTRNKTLYGLGRSLHTKGLSHDAILAALRVENAAKGRPPLEDEELQKIAANAFTQPDRPDFHPPAGDTSAGNQAAGRADGTPILVNLADVRIPTIMIAQSDRS